IDRVKEILIEEASRHELVLKDPEPFCRLSEQGDSSLIFVLRVWVETANYWQVKFDVLEAVHKRLAAEGVEIPFPQMDVHVKQ
ncbi:MAG: mechanosensitive ion channel, partial [Clostridia bacterium]|nr:mechanosensitive ion channel [Clostridia bacterium]